MSIRTFQNITPRIGDSVYIDESAIVIGDVDIGDHSSVWPYSVIRADVNTIRIGRLTNIQDHSVLHVSHAGPYNPEGNALDIGDNVTIGHRVTLHGCTIHHNVLIGMGSTIMDGVIIHPHTLVGAGSLVTPGKELEGGYLWAGSPARRLRALSDREVESLQYSAEHYQRLKDRYLS